MMVSERIHCKDVKSEIFFEICLSTQKIAFLQFNFPPFCYQKQYKMAGNSRARQIIAC